MVRLKPADLPPGEAGGILMVLHPSLLDLNHFRLVKKEAAAASRVVGVRGEAPWLTAELHLLSECPRGEWLLSD